MIRKVRAVAVTEFLNTVLSRGFLLALILTPLFLFGAVLVQKFVKERVDTDDRIVAVYDRSGAVLGPLQEAARERNERGIFLETPAGKRRIEPRFVFVPFTPKRGEDAALALAGMVRDGAIFSYILIPEGILRLDRADDAPKITYHTQTHTFTLLPAWLHPTFGKILRDLRITGQRLDPRLVAALEAPVPLKWRRLHTARADGKAGTAGKVNLAASFGVPTGAMLLLFVLVFMSAPMLLHSVIEEKQQRIWEVLVSSVSPFQLLLGKLFGAVGVSFCLSLFYLAGAASFLDVMGVSDAVPLSLYAWFLFFQLLALLIYGSIFSAIGAACSELRDAQTLMMPAMLLIIIPMFGWVEILRAPSSAFSRWLSLFPPATPVLMLLRIALPPGPRPWEIALAIVLTSLFTAACVWAAGKIFRIGILAQGQTPSVRKLVSWVLAK